MDNALCIKTQDLIKNLVRKVIKNTYVAVTWVVNGPVI